MEVYAKQKTLKLFVYAQFIIIFTCAQDVRKLSVISRRRLPTVIITREHLRRQNSYGNYGDTAAEFVVSAGLDTSKNSAVRIRRIGNGGQNATHNPNIHRFGVLNATRRLSHPHINENPPYRTTVFSNSDEPNTIPKTRVSINRRYHLNENEQRFRTPNGGIYQNINRNPAIPERGYYQYRPPIFVPNYQQNRRADLNFIKPEEANKRITNVVFDEVRRRNNLNTNQQIYPVVNVKYSTSSVSATVSQKPQQVPVYNEDLNKKIPLPFKNNNKQEIPRGEIILQNNQPVRYLLQNNNRNHQKERTAVPNNTDYLHVSRNDWSAITSNQHAQKSNKESNSVTLSIAKETINESQLSENVRKTDHTGNNDQKEEDQNARKNDNSNKQNPSKNTVIKPSQEDKNVGIETLTTESSTEKSRDSPTILIRKPSLILRDQITVNEVPRKSNRPRYGPRSLEHTEENISLSRRKRETIVSNDERLNIESISKDQNETRLINNEENISVSSNVTENSNIYSSSSQRQARYSFGSNFPQWRGNTSSVSSSSSTQSQKTILPIVEKESRVAPVYEMFSDGTYDTTEDISESDIMSFSDFISSPIADKLRLERQLLFKNSNVSKENSSTGESVFNNRKMIDSRSSKNDTMAHLRSLIAAKILDRILNLNNNTMNDSMVSKSSRSSDSLSSAEQRHIGIMVTPFDEHESEDYPRSKPVIRILRGRIISLPDLPEELIPIILGTYKPSNKEPEEPMYHDNAKLTENILDNAIYKLLQNEELLSFRPIARKPSQQVIYKNSRKSPSTNYIGSLKNNEPSEKNKFIYKPNEWSLDPRCDRLTEEICLDDSDYPSSAIMTSIYKDKARFDMMYAEVKVHESQVEGLSRQQERAYSFDQNYGSYHQSSGSHLVPRDYGPQGGFVCPSEVHYAKPHRAKNRKGEWKVVVNVGEYTQTLRMEKCLSSGNPCKYVVNQMQSTCAQVYSYHRLLVFSKEKGLHIDVFRVPAACTCYLRPDRKSYSPNIAASSPYLMRPNPYDDYGGHVETAPVPQVHVEASNMNKEKKKNSFSNTLWAILGGGPQASALAQQPQFLDEVQKQITWTQQINKFPHLVKQISPNQVLKQLLEDEDEDYSIRRQRIRQKHPFDQLTSNNFGSYQMPMVVPLPPPPPPPPSSIPRRPVISAAPADKQHIFSLSPDSQTKIITISSDPEQTKVFSLTKDPHSVSSFFRPNSDSSERNVYTIVRQQPFNRKSGYKVQPGMYPPQSENVQIPESSFLPVAPQFSSHPDNPLRPIMKPMPAPKGSDKDIVEDDDLMAAEKSVEESMHSFASDMLTDTKAIQQQDDSESKVNFSYHPILEYLNV